VEAEVEVVIVHQPQQPQRQQLTLSADPTSVLLESTSTLTWSSTNATSCSAAWTTQTGSSGSEAVTISTAGNNLFQLHVLELEALDQHQ
jgi:hypothetical protein